MGLINLKGALEPALSQGCAVRDFDVINSDLADSIVSAGENKKSPLSLSVCEMHLKYVDLEPTTDYLSCLASRSPLPVVLRLDHGLSDENIQRAADCGFPSVMIDGSGSPFRENIEKTRKIVDLCHPLGIFVEAELGAVRGGEGGSLEG